MSESPGAWRTTYAMDALEKVRQASIETAPAVATAMRHLQFSLFQDKSPADIGMSPEEREKTPSGTIGTRFGRVKLETFVSRMDDWAKMDGRADVATGVAKAVGAGSIEMLVLWTKIEEAHSRHEARRAKVGEVDRGAMMAAKTVSEALMDAGIALGTLVAHGKGGTVAGNVLRTIPVHERHCRQDRQPFPVEMALIKAIDFVVSGAESDRKKVVSRDQDRRMADRSYALQQNTIEQSVSGALSNRQIAVQNLQPFSITAKRVWDSVQRVLVAKAHYPDALREVYVAGSKPIVIPDQAGFTMPGKVRDTPAIPMEILPIVRAPAVAAGARLN